MVWTVVDLFSGAGGMSYGFHIHPDFELVGAVDAQMGKPSSGCGTLDCNKTYMSNVGLLPFEHDLNELNGEQLAELLSPGLKGRELDVMLACPPCTGFSRTNPNNHLEDDPRNRLVPRVADWVSVIRPAVLIMENARELLKGRFSSHFEELKEKLEVLGYQVHGEVHMLDRFGLPQRRERALITAVCQGRILHTINDLWGTSAVRAEATLVRTAIKNLPSVEAGKPHPSDDLHVSPRFARESTRRRLELLPHDGGSWVDLKGHVEADFVLTPAMKRHVERGKFGSHPDVYGRLWWDKPSVTIKRECAHVGNGRYSHPEQDRLLTVREMALLQGFPSSYRFVSSSLSNKYRHIGDAVPPLISYQLAWLTRWILSGEKPAIENCLLPGGHLTPEDIIVKRKQPTQAFFDFARAKK